LKIVVKIPMLATRVLTNIPKNNVRMNAPGFVVMDDGFVMAPHVIASAKTPPITPQAILQRNIWRPLPKATLQLTMLKSTGFPTYLRGAQEGAEKKPEDGLRF